MQHNKKLLGVFIMTTFCAGNFLSAMDAIFDQIPAGKFPEIPVKVSFDMEGFGKNFGKEFGENIGKNFNVALKGIAENINAGADLGHSAGKNTAQGINAFASAMNNSDIYGNLRTTSWNLGAGTVGAFIESLGWSFGKFSLYVAGGLAFITAAYYGTVTLWNYIERKLRKPRVVIEQKTGIWYRFKRWMFGEKAEEMVLDPAVKDYLDHVVKTTKVIKNKIRKKETDIYYRNVLLAGAPGTGKTMFARQLAKLTGMEFIEVTGSSFFQEGAGIGAVDELFSWARSCKGLIIFIDEADSLLPDRAQVRVATEEYRIINHFLNYLGQRSSKFMVIMATNYAVVFDEAMERRFDDYIEIPLPSLKTRFKVLCHYRDTILVKSRVRNKAFVNSVNMHLSDKKLRDIAHKTDQLSNGHLQGIINAIKTDADVTEEGLVTPELIDLAVDRYINKHTKLHKYRVTPAPMTMQLSAMPVGDMAAATAIQ